jgi:hypothetical protein
MDNRKRMTGSSPAALALVINGTLTGIGAVFVTTSSVTVTALATLAALATAFMWLQRGGRTAQVPQESLAGPSQKRTLATLDNRGPLTTRRRAGRTWP